MRFEITCFFTHIRMTIQTVPYLYHIHKRTAVWGLGCHLFFIVHLHNCKMAKMAVVTNPIEMMCLTTPAEMESCGWGARHSCGSWNREALEPSLTFRSQKASDWPWPRPRPRQEGKWAPSALSRPACSPCRGKVLFSGISHKDSCFHDGVVGICKIKCCAPFTLHLSSVPSRILATLNRQGCCHNCMGNKLIQTS